MFAPRSFAVCNNLPLLDMLLGEREGNFVELDAAIRLRASVTDCAETNDQSNPCYTIEFANDCCHSPKPKRLPHSQKWQQYSPQRAVVQLGRTLEWGSRGRGFKSRQPEKIFRHGLTQMKHRLFVRKIEKDLCQS